MELEWKFVKWKELGLKEVARISHHRMMCPLLCNFVCFLYSDCSIGSYLAETSNRTTVCRPCPENSVSTSSNSRFCVCLQGYYRNLLEAIHVPCTSKSQSNQVISVVANILHK